MCLPLKATQVNMLFVCCTRLPDRLVVTFPKGNEIKNGDKKPAGSTIGRCCICPYFIVIFIFLLTVCYVDFIQALCVHFQLKN